MTEKFAHYLLMQVPKWIQSCEIQKPELSVYVHPQYLEAFLLYLRDHMNTQYKALMDVTAVDYPSRETRFQVVYNLLSVEFNTRIRVKTCVDETTPVASSTSIYSSAGWWEREVWDMFGIFFTGHPDLRRILTDYGFEGHPLRKDFPLTGYTEVRYDDSEKRVISEELELSQEFRYFEFSPPWDQLPKSS